MKKDNLLINIESTEITTQKNSKENNIKIIQGHKEENVPIFKVQKEKGKENAIQKNINDESKENNNDICDYSHLENSIISSIDLKFDLDRFYNALEENFKSLPNNDSFNSEKNEKIKEKENEKEIEYAQELLNIKIYPPDNNISDDCNINEQKIYNPLNKKRKINEIIRKDKGKILKNSSIQVKKLLKKGRSTHDYLIKKFLSNFLNKFLFKKLRRFGIHKCNYKIYIKPNENGLLPLLKKTIKEVFTYYTSDSIDGTSNQKKNEKLIKEFYNKKNFPSSQEEEELKELLESTIETYVEAYYKSSEIEDLKKKKDKYERTVKDLDEDFKKERNRGYYLLEANENFSEKFGFIIYANSKPYCHNQRKKKE